MKKKKVGMQSPWITYLNKVKALFERDPEITIEYDEKSYTIKYFIDNTTKSDALAKLIPSEVPFGNITVKNEIIPSNNDDINYLELVETAFKGNPIFSKVISGDKKGLFTLDYALFNKEVIQFYNDDLSDAYGNFNGLAEDIAREILNVEGVNFCTDIETN